MKLYVGNLPFSVTQDQLEETFGAFGDVASVEMITDRFTGESKGFAFVEMPNNSHADAAIKGLKDTMMGGRKVKVNQAQAKTGGRGGKRGRR